MERIELKTLSQKDQLPQIQHGETIVQLGSCFSTHMTSKFQQAGFEVLDNPLGIVFHPIPLAKQIELAFSAEPDLWTVWKEDVCLSYHASSQLYALREEALREKFLEALLQLKNALLKAKIVFVTFGSAHGYRLMENEQIVANCHQQSSLLFDKELTPSNEMLYVWEEIIARVKAYNPAVEFVFTISPVRYIRDGLLENSQSKATLFHLVSALKPVGHYFPAYELVVDVLRDYRYFEHDGVHPNQLAVDFVWDFVRQEFLSEKTNQLVDELTAIRKMEAHRLLYPESKNATKYLNEVKRKRESFLSLHPNIIW